MIGKKATCFKYTLLWLKLYSFVPTKFFIFLTYNQVEELQLTDTDFMVITHSGQLSQLINIRYWKKVVTETGIQECHSTIKYTSFYINIISPEWKKTESLMNK